MSEKFYVQKSLAHVGYVIWWGSIHICEVFGAQLFAQSICDALNKARTHPDFEAIMRDIRGDA